MIRQAARDDNCLGNVVAYICNLQRTENAGVIEEAGAKAIVMSVRLLMDCLSMSKKIQKIFVPEVSQ